MTTQEASARPVVSVILPTFNRVHYLRPAVDSVLAQTYEDWELIVADDGSADEARTYLQSLATLPKAKVLWLAHSGNPGRVRNAALREARGEYIAFLDSDDVWMPRKLELQIRLLHECPSRPWSYTAINHINSDGVQINAALSAAWRYYEGRIFQQLLTLQAGVAMPSVMVKRQLLQEVGGFDESQGQHEDYHLWLRLALRCEISVIRQPLACVRCHQEHFSDFGVGALRARDRMLARILAVVNDRGQRNAVRAERARNAAMLAAADAARGNLRPAWRTVAETLPFSWHFAAWWGGVVRVVAHTYLPNQAKAMIRHYRRSHR